MSTQNILDYKEKNDKNINFSCSGRDLTASEITCQFNTSSVNDKIVKYVINTEVNKEVVNMAVEKVGEKYRCNICGNEVVVSKVGGGTLVCCGEDMEKIE